ncbi:MAG: XdhC family protein, partial [Bacilli bacterium]|nr:XdhC family protein [Bacilli bacterium]
MSQVFDELIKYKNQGIKAVLVTVIDKKGDGPVEVGKKMVVNEYNQAFGTVGGGALEYYAREHCKEVLKSRNSYSERYLLNEGKVIKDAVSLPMVCGGVVTLFYEYVGAKDYIYIFGAGHVGQALCNILKTMNYHVTVIDDRKEVYESFTGADVKVNKPFVQFIEEEGIKDDSFIVVCTPSHQHDYNVIDKVIERKINHKYMGMLCSPDKLQSYLEKTYDKFGKDIDLSNFYSPIGLDLGGGSPEEIAISITAEIL